MASDLTIKYDCRIYVFKYVDYDILASAPTGTDVIPSGWSDVPQQQLDANKMNVCSWSNYDFVNSRSLGDWCTPFVVTGTPLSGTLDYGYNFGYSDDANIPPSTWYKILAIPTGDYMFMEKFRVVNNEAIRTYDQILINNESELYTNYLRDVVIHKYDSVSESMTTKVLSGCEIYMNTEIADEYFTGREYVIFENEKYYLDPLNVQKSNDKNSGKWKYILSFTNEHSVLERTPFKNIASIEADPQFYTNQNEVNFVGNLAELKDRINANLTKSYSAYNYQVVYDSGFVPSITDYQEINITNATIKDALAIFYDTFGVLFHFSGYNIVLGFAADNLTNVFEYGALGGGLEISKSVNKKHIITSVSGKGGQTNIPYRYPLVRDADGVVINHPYTSTYLMPTCYTETVRRKVQTDAVDYDENIMILNSYEAVSGDTYLNDAGTPVDVEYENYLNAGNFSHEFIDFEDIYPTISGVLYGGQRIDKIKSVSYEEADTLIYTDDSIDVAPFYIELHPLGFDLYAHTIETGEMSLKMQSGDCSGCEFKVLGLSNLTYTANKVYFATAGNTTYSPSDFRVYFDSVLFDLLQEAIDYSAVVDPSAPHTSNWNTKVRNHIKGKVINGLTVNQILKQNVDFLMESEDIYCNMRNMYVDTTIWGAYTVGDNDLYTLSTEVNSLNTNWNTGLTYAQFATLCEQIRTHVQWMRNVIGNTNPLFLKDYADREYPPTDLYVRGSFFVLSTRDTTEFPDSTNASITLKVLKDDSTYGTILPNQFVRPKATDAFTILNISLPTAYITAAQRRLDKSLKLYLQSKNRYNNTYVLKLSSIFLANNSSIANELVVDSFMSFKYKNSTIKQQIKRVTRNYDSLPYNYTIEFYNEDEKPKTQSSRLLTLQQIVASTRRNVTNQTIQNRKLWSTTSTKFSAIEQQQTLIGGLAEGKSTTFLTEPIPPYKMGDMWNDNGVMKRCNNEKLSGQTFSSNDWIVTTKTSQFVKGLDQKIDNIFNYDQGEDFTSITALIDNDSTITLYNSGSFMTENTIIVFNNSGLKDYTLTLNHDNIGDVLCDSAMPITIADGYAARISISYTKELIAIISVKSGLTNII